MYRNIVAAVLLSFAFAAAAFAADGKAQCVAFHVDQNDPGVMNQTRNNVTKTAMEKRKGHAIAVVPEAVVVRSVAVHLMELQEQGFSHVRP